MDATKRATDAIRAGIEAGQAVAERHHTHLREVDLDALAAAAVSGEYPEPAGPTDWWAEALAAAAEAGSRAFAD